MQNFLKGSHFRLIRIEDMSDRFTITNQWSRKAKIVCTLPREIGMFHYSMLTNIEIRKAWWKTDFPGNRHARRIEWLDKIYLKYDLRDEDFWLAENLKISGINSPWFNHGFIPDENGRLFKYGGRHPKFIENSDLTGIIDFRKYYEEKKI